MQNANDQTQSNEDKPSFVELTIADFVNIHSEVSGSIINAKDILELVNRAIEDIQITKSAILGNPMAVGSLTKSYITRLFNKPSDTTSALAIQSQSQEPQKVRTTIKEAAFGNPFAILILTTTLLKLAHKYGYQQIYRIKLPVNSLSKVSIDYLKKHQFIQEVQDNGMDSVYEFSLGFMEIFDFDPSFVDFDFATLNNRTNDIKDKLQLSRLQANEVIFQKFNSLLGIVKK
jgi:hypothetical protein